MARPQCSDAEQIVRAICSPHHYDPQSGRISPSVFDKNGGTSVSRLKLLGLNEHWSLFREELESPPQRLELIGEINVGMLKKIGLDYVEGPAVGKRTPRPIKLTVEEAPEDWNAAHAEIPEPITRGLANSILPKLTLHRSS